MVTILGHPRDGEDEEEPALETIEVGGKLQKECLRSQIKSVLRQTSMSNAAAR